MGETLRKLRSQAQNEEILGFGWDTRVMVFCGAREVMSSNSIRDINLICP